jgi:hypothetical protein
MRYPFIIAMAVVWLCVTHPYGFVMFVVGAIGFHTSTVAAAR